MIKRFLLFFIGTMMVGCSTPHGGLNGYLGKFGYTAFNLPRAGDGVGTIIDFKNRSESIVARGNECFLKANRDAITTRIVAAADLESKVDWAAGASFNVPKAVIEYVDVAGLAKASGAKSVKVSLREPFEQYISRLQFEAYINSIDASDSCKPLISDPDNLLIYQVLGAKGITYQFGDSSDNSIALTAKILDQVNLNPELRRTSQNAGKIETNEILLIGYRAWIVTKPSGVIGTGMSVKEINKKEVEARRESSR